MLGFKFSSTSVGFGVMVNLTWYQSRGLRFNSLELRRRRGVGVSGTSTWYNRHTYGNIKTSGLAATLRDRAL